MKFYLIAGEASGDLHASNLLKAMHELQPGLQCRAWGGDLMQQAGATLVKHYRDLAFMGFVEVLKNLRTILGNLKFCKEDILNFKPDALILIDYPGFNLRIAKWAKQQGIPVVYYISPQIWAWHVARVKAIRRDVDLMLVILPFEADFYRKHGMEAVYVGHPLLDVEGLQRPPASRSKTIALLPGSRAQEVRKILPRMLSVVPAFPSYRFVIAGARNLPESFYSPFLTEHRVELRRGDTYSVLQSAEAALVKSGTSTLETALCDTPQVVCYAGNPLSYQIARRLVQVPYISLVNLVVDKPLVRELIQDELNTPRIIEALTDILDSEKAAAMRAGYAALRHQLGAGGASGKAARSILRFVDESKKKRSISEDFKGQAG